MENTSVKEEEKVYMAEDIQRILKLGKSKTYDFLREVADKQVPFKVIKVGKLLRVPKKPFDDWVSGGVS